MTTSGSYTFTVTRDEIIREAMLNIGKIGDTEVPTPTETNDCARKLNMLVKQWMGRQDFAPGLKMWTRQRADLFLSSSQYCYSLGPSGDNWAAGVTGVPGANFGQSQLTATTAASSATLTVGAANVSKFTVGDYCVVQLTSGDTFTSTVASKGASTVVLNAVLPSAAAAGNYVFNYTTKGQRPLEIQTIILRDQGGSDTPVDLMTLQVYEALPNKTQSTFLADPAAVYYEAQLTNGKLYIDCGGAQDVTKYLHVVYLRPVQDMNSASDNPEYPQEWFDALCWGLSKRICPMFNAPWTQEMELNYQETLRIAQESNPETTQIYFMAKAEDFG